MKVLGQVICLVLFGVTVPAMTFTFGTEMFTLLFCAENMRLRFGFMGAES